MGFDLSVRVEVLDTGVARRSALLYLCSEEFYFFLHLDSPAGSGHRFDIRLSFIPEGFFSLTTKYFLKECLCKSYTEILKQSLFQQEFQDFRFYAFKRYFGINSNVKLMIYFSEC